MAIDRIRRPAECPYHRWWKLAVLGILLLGLGSAASAQLPGSRVSDEFEVKAVFLFNFARFVDWPLAAFSSPTSPIVIGVLGADPFGPFLDATVRGETVNGRPLIVHRFRRVTEIGACHILFVSGSEGSRAGQIVSMLRDRPILTVGDWQGFARAGGMVWFVNEGPHVRLRINLDAIRTAQLTISSKLLRCADAVTSSDARQP